MEHFNGLSPAEAERLALLSEELGEAQQAIGKILRHGYESRHPDGGATNRESLERECGDVSHAIDRLSTANDLSRQAISKRQWEKAGSVLEFLHHNDIDPPCKHENTGLVRIDSDARIFRCHDCGVIIHKPNALHERRFWNGG